MNAQEKRLLLALVALVIIVFIAPIVSGGLLNGTGMGMMQGAGGMMGGAMPGAGQMPGGQGMMPAAMTGANGWVWGLAAGIGWIGRLAFWGSVLVGASILVLRVKSAAGITDGP